MGDPVVTGMGCVTPIGVGRAEFSAALRAGRSGTRAAASLDAARYACQVAAEVGDFSASDFMRAREARTSPRVVQLAVAAARLALADAGLANWRDAARVGVFLGSSVGPSAYNFDQFGTFLERGVRRIPPDFPAQAHYGVIPSECAIQLGVHGPVMAISSACTSSADAIGLGGAMIRSGVVDVMIVGGAEAPICPMLFAAFDRLRLMPSGFNAVPHLASRPFAADRGGFVLGEGAGVLILEDAHHAISRGGRPIAHLAGYGATCDAESHFSHAADGRDAAAAIRAALGMAGRRAEEIDYVNAHGSATRQNDSFETRVFHEVLGSRAKTVPVSSSKSMHGHLLGASAAVELVATIIGMDEGFVPPTINLYASDPECDLDYVPNQSRALKVSVALSTSFGFGARNAALVVTRVGDDG
ncbi:MAG: beta-ketoacyl-[acyl-carrier-protein] synthase family protein [Deltaproteobacteria bacterium]|nr:beta-ketoacyl-[acyl-carrier-protein] synthase family protein [Deltaproteobacteria bacterium]